MVELGEFTLLALCLVIQWVFNSCLNSQEAALTERCKCCTSMFCSHSNTIHCSLSNSCILGIRLVANLLDNLRIDGTQELWSQELNHIIKNEE
jgi:hypothetical protein